MQGGIGTRTYMIEDDTKVKQEVIAKFTKMVDDPKFGEKYSVVPCAFHYVVMSNISKTVVFKLVLHAKDYLSLSKNYHSIIAPGIAPTRYNCIDEDGFHFFHGEAAHIYSKLKECASIQKTIENRQIIANKQARESAIRDSALEKLINIK